MPRSALSSGEAAAETEGGKGTELSHQRPLPAPRLGATPLQAARAAQGSGLQSEGVSFPVHPGCAFRHTSLVTVFHCCLEIKPNC